MANSNDGLFAFAQNYAEARAKALGGNIVKGAAAFEAEDTPVRRDLSETQFNVGDKIVLPANATSDQWINTPLTRGQNPVTRALCEVTAADGTKSVKELFLGTLMKSVQNRETKQNVSVTGNIVEYTRNCVTKKEVWEKLFGKTLEVVGVQMVPIIRRGFNGQPDRATETSVLKINVL
jgi:hypothetical protein